MDDHSRTKSAMNGSTVRPHGLILRQDEATDCTHLLEPPLAYFRQISDQYLTETMEINMFAAFLHILGVGNAVFCDWRDMQSVPGCTEVYQASSFHAISMMLFTKSSVHETTPSIL